MQHLFCYKSNNHLTNATAFIVQITITLQNKEKNMKETATEFSAYIPEANAMMVICIVVILFTTFIIFMMVRDYRLYLESNSKRKFSLSDFIKREQFYLYLILFFYFLFAADMCVQYILVK